MSDSVAPYIYSTYTRCVECGAGTTNINSLCLECDRKMLFVSIGDMLLNITTVQTVLQRKDIAVRLYILLNERPCWIDRKYEKFKRVVIYKAYEIIGELNILGTSIFSLEDIESATRVMTKTLESCLCNKWLTKEKRYCKRKKVGKYCKYHFTLKGKIDSTVKVSVDPYLDRDVISVILSLVD